MYKKKHNLGQSYFKFVAQVSLKRQYFVHKYFCYNNLKMYFFFIYIFEPKQDKGPSMVWKLVVLTMT